jgi:D-cysteine desulfhydrase
MKKFLFSLVCIALHAEPFKPVAKKIAESFGITINADNSLCAELNQKGIFSQYAHHTHIAAAAQAEKLPLFKAFPQLAQTIAYVPCAHLPTPVEHLNAIKVYLNNGCKILLVKRDDLTGTQFSHKKIMYGGNKVRKLEFLLGQALSCNAQEVITFGAAGSNHALATALYAHKFGLHCTNLLMPQSTSVVVQQNLLHAYCAHAKLLYFTDNDTRTISAFSEWLNSYNRTGIYPYIIPKGGSNSIGTLGFVNAAFELKEQINAGILQKPDYIYVASGTCGTVAGLALGFQLAELPIHIMAVTTEQHDPIHYQQELAQLYHATNNLLHEKDNTIPLQDFPHALVTIRFNFASPGYGVANPESQQAEIIFKKYAKIRLDVTYTGKAAAALIADMRAGLLTDKKVLFWDTYCGLDFSKTISKTSYKDLPACFHSYFS